MLPALLRDEATPTPAHAVGTSEVPILTAALTTIAARMDVQLIETLIEQRRALFAIVSFAALGAAADG